jgi:hypothetical protein
MDGGEFQAARGYRLDQPGHPQGVSCDEHGPALGAIRFLTKYAAGFAPRPIQELNLALGRTFGQPLDCADLLPGLRAVSRALDEGNLARATQLLRLPTLSEAQAQAQRAAGTSLSRSGGKRGSR